MVCVQRVCRVCGGVFSLGRVTTGPACSQLSLRCSAWVPGPIPHSLASPLSWPRAGDPEKRPHWRKSKPSLPPAPRDSPLWFQTCCCQRCARKARRPPPPRAGPEAWAGWRLVQTSALHPQPFRHQGGPATRETGQNASTRPRLPACGALAVSTGAEDRQGAAGVTQRPKSTVRLAPPPARAPGGVLLALQQRGRLQRTDSNKRMSQHFST